jgi:hypothetical protein
MLNRISEITPFTSIYNELFEEEMESSPKQEDEVLIAKPQLLQSQGLAIHPNPSIPQNPPREEDDLFGVDFGKILNSHKRPSSEYNSNPLKKRPLRKCPYSHIGHREEFKDDMSSDAIEGKSSHLEANPIFSPSMPVLDILFEPISQPILDPYDPSHALSPKSHDGPRNLLRQPKHRSHEDHKDDQEEQQQCLECINNWLECIKNSYAVAKEWMDKDEAL